MSGRFLSPLRLNERSKIRILNYVPQSSLREHIHKISKAEWTLPACSSVFHISIDRNRLRRNFNLFHFQINRNSFFFNISEIYIPLICCRFPKRDGFRSCLNSEISRGSVLVHVEVIMAVLLWTCLPRKDENSYYIRNFCPPRTSLIEIQQKTHPNNGQSSSVRLEAIPILSQLVPNKVSNNVAVLEVRRPFPFFVSSSLCSDSPYFIIRLHISVFDSLINASSTGNHDSISSKNFEIVCVWNELSTQSQRSPATQIQNGRDRTYLLERNTHHFAVVVFYWRKNYSVTRFSVVHHLYLVGTERGGVKKISPEIAQ